MPTLICTGCSSGLGLNALLHLTRSAASEWRILLGSRSTSLPPDLLSNCKPGTITHHPLDLLNHDSVTAFATNIKDVLSKEQRKATHVLLCAGMNDSTFRPVDRTTSFSREAVVNHFAQRDLLEALEDVLEPEARIVVVSSSLHTSAPALSDILNVLKGTQESKDRLARYKASKLLQLAYAQSYARSHPARPVIAISPGFVPDTGLAREGAGWTRLLMRYVLPWMPFATSIKVGSEAISRGVTIPTDDINWHEGDLVYLDKNGARIEYDERVATDEAHEMAMIDYLA